jgi:hypothetical protein
MTTIHPFPTTAQSVTHAPLGRAEARRLCQAALAGVAPRERSLLVEVDAHGVCLIVAAGCEPIAIWSVGLDAAEEDRAIAEELTRARLGFLRGWFRRGIVISRRPTAGRRRARVLGALADFLGLAELGETAIAVPRAA